MARSKKKAENILDEPLIPQLIDEITIKGARSNNLKNIDLVIPKNQLVVVTGMSGSGKSSLIMDTLYAEGQRRYVESLSSYARQFLTRMKKPEVDFIKGLCPAIAIEQKVSTSNPRSTVGSMTEIYDYLRLLFARLGRTYSPITGHEVKKHQISDVVDAIFTYPEGAKVQVYAPFSGKHTDRTLDYELQVLMQKGFTRVVWQNEVLSIQDLLEEKPKWIQQTLKKIKDKGCFILIDRFGVNKSDDDTIKRAADSVQSAFYESEGDCVVNIDGEIRTFNNRFELDGLTFLEPAPQLFNYNNSYGACPTCEGYGKVMGIDEQKVIPDPSKSVYEGAVACWHGDKSSKWLDHFIRQAQVYDFPVHRPYHDLSEAQKDLLWHGKGKVEGIHAFFEELEANLYKIQNRVMLARYRGKTTCSTCKGGRLRPEAYHIKIGGHHIADLVKKSIMELRLFFDQLKLNDHDRRVGTRLIMEVQMRLKIMEQIGLEYLSLDRLANTLSGGETQRINLTRTLGSNLTNSLYILDEPSVGLHPRDTARLVKVLKELRDLKNTVVVIEHEEEAIRQADYIVDIGPQAGVHGGEVIFSGPYTSFIKSAGLTARYMRHDLRIPLPETRRRIVNKILIQGARQHNLKNIDVTIPLQAMTAVTGVSGSGKTTLIKHILYPAMKKFQGEPLSINAGVHAGIAGDVQEIKITELINQNPIGKSSRSNPVTYVKAYDNIRDLMSRQPLSKLRGYKPGFFSFNTDGGRCDTCKGEGEIVVEMQFLADVRLTCEDCQGTRFKPEIREVEYKGRNISQILDLTIEEAVQFFKEHLDIVQKIQPLYEVGLGYLKLGQSSSTLSGGEAQRVKLASYLGKERPGGQILFIFDEPTTGLHFHDIRKLLYAFNALVENGHTVLIVEHNLEVVKCCDWVIDLGPGSGDDGGHLVFQGRPEELAQVKESFTGQYLKESMASN